MVHRERRRTGVGAYAIYVQWRLFDRCTFKVDFFDLNRSAAAFPTSASELTNFVTAYNAELQVRHESRVVGADGRLPYTSTMDNASRASLRRRAQIPRAAASAPERRSTGTASPSNRP